MEPVKKHEKAKRMKVEPSKRLDKWIKGTD
jgi:hypothetical protein